LIRGAKLGGRNVRARGMGHDIRLGDRVDDEIRAEQQADRQESPAQIPPDQAAAPSRPPEGDEPDTDQQEARGNCEEPREVVARRAGLARVVAGLAHAHHDREEAEAEGERRSGAGSKPWIDPGGEDEERGLHEAADEVVTGRGAGLRLEEVVVDDVKGRDPEREPREPGLGPQACRGSRRGRPVGIGERLGRGGHGPRSRRSGLGRQAP
jgi:hypothetical protein